MDDRKQSSSKEHYPPEEQKMRKKESIPSMLERGMKAVEGNNRLLKKKTEGEGEHWQGDNISKRCLGKF